MSYKIIADSCCEFPEEYKEDPRFVNIPLGLDVAGEHLWDDETFDQASFLQKVASSKTCPRSCCPSPEKYMRADQQSACHAGERSGAGTKRTCIRRTSAF